MIAVQDIVSLIWLALMVLIIVLVDKIGKDKNGSMKTAVLVGMLLAIGIIPIVLLAYTYAQGYHIEINIASDWNIKPKLKWSSI